MERSRGTVKKIISNVENAVQFFNLPPHKRRKRQLIEIMNLIKHIPFFSKYIENGWPDICQQCLEFMQVEQFEPNQVIFEQGSQGEQFYIILEGQAGVFVNIAEKFTSRRNSLTQSELFDSASPISPPIKEKHIKQCVKVLDSGDSFGELALIYNRPRLASIITFEKTYLAVLNKKNFVRIVRDKEQQQIFKEIQYLVNLPYFDKKNLNLLRELHINFNPITVHIGQTIFFEGDHCKAVYLIRSGHFQVFRTINFEWKMDDGQDARQFMIDYPLLIGNDRKFVDRIEIPLRVIGVDEIFGEEDLIKRRKRTIGVRCISEKGELLFLKKGMFFTKAISNYKTNQIIRQQVERKLRDWNAQEQLFRDQMKPKSGFLISGKHKILLESRLKQLSEMQSSLIQENVSFEKQICPNQETKQTDLIYQPDTSKFYKPIIQVFQDAFKTPNKQNQLFNPPKPSIKYKPPKLKNVEKPSFSYTGFELSKHSPMNLNGYQVLQATLKIKNQVPEENPIRLEQLRILNDLAHDLHLYQQTKEYQKSDQKNQNYEIRDSHREFEDPQFKAIEERIPKKIEIFDKLQKNISRVKEHTYQVQDIIPPSNDYLRLQRNFDEQRGVTFFEKIKNQIMKKHFKPDRLRKLDQFSKDDLSILENSNTQLKLNPHPNSCLAKDIGVILNEFEKIIKKSKNEESTYKKMQIDEANLVQNLLNKQPISLIKGKINPLVFRNRNYKDPFIAKPISELLNKKRESKKIIPSLNEKKLNLQLKRLNTMQNLLIQSNDQAEDKIEVPQKFHSMIQLSSDKIMLDLPIEDHSIYLDRVHTDNEVEVTEINFEGLDRTINVSNDENSMKTSPGHPDSSFSKNINQETLYQQQKNNQDNKLSYQIKAEEDHQKITKFPFFPIIRMPLYEDQVKRLKANKKILRNNHIMFRSFSKKE